MSQSNDPSRSPVPFAQERTLIVVIEMSQSSWLGAGVVPGVERQPRKRLCQLSSLLGATFSGCGASCSSSFQNTKRDGCPAHVVKAPCSGGNVLAHARSRAEEVAEFVVTAAISSC
jgi:hypothetical protein